MKRRKFFKRSGWFFLILFVLVNILAFLHARSFTHFSNTSQAKTNADKLTMGQKLSALLTGISIPRPVNKQLPQHPFETVYLQSNKRIECWYMKAASAKGTVLICHGYGGEKSSMLDKAEIFLQSGYNTLLVDFMGSGGSEGHQTTIGYKEAEEVKSCYDYLVAKNEKRIWLFGTSMGAAAILKAMNDYPLQPAGIIIECPFGSLYQTTCARFKALGVPAFPMADLLVFWGGVQNGFWGFSHQPVEYAKKVHCPTLLMYGEQDKRVSYAEIDDIYKNLDGPKTLQLFPQAGHENYLTKYQPEWTEAVKAFMK